MKPHGFFLVATFPKLSEALWERLHSLQLCCFTAPRLRVAHCFEPGFEVENAVVLGDEGGIGDGEGALSRFLSFPISRLGTRLSANLRFGNRGHQKRRSIDSERLRCNRRSANRRFGDNYVPNRRLGTSALGGGYGAWGAPYRNVGRPFACYTSVGRLLTDEPRYSRSMEIAPES